MSRKETRLGRGLSALLGDLSEEASLRELPLDSIVPSPFQPRRRIPEEELEELVKSVKEKGVLQPVLVREVSGGVYELVAGHRRFLAARRAGLSSIPAIVKRLSDEEALTVALIENLQRQDLNPVEEAEGYRRLVEEFGLSQEEVARRVGKDRSTVANALRLLKLPREVKEDLIEGRLTAGHARALLSLEEESLILEARNEVLRKGLSVRETERLVARIKKGLSASRSLPEDPDLKALSVELSELLRAKASVKLKRGRPVFSFEFASLEEAEEFLKRLREVFSRA